MAKTLSLATCCILFLFPSYSQGGGKPPECEYMYLLKANFVCNLILLNV